MTLERPSLTTWDALATRPQGRDLVADFRRLVSAYHFIGLFGDSNAAGFDNGTADWRTRIDLPSFTSRTAVDGNIWNKWTVGPNASRSSAAATGTTFRQAELGFGGSPAGGGQFATGVGCEVGLAETWQRHLRPFVGNDPDTGGSFDLGFIKYGISGSVVHPNPANPATGWHPTGAANGCFKVYANYYMREALLWCNAEGYTVGDVLYGPRYWGSVVFLGGTDAIDPASVFTEPGDAEAIDYHLQTVVQTYHEWLGVPRAMTVLVVPPRVNLTAASNLGYPNMPLVQQRIRDLAARRTAAGYRTIAVEVGDCERIADGLHYSNFGQWTAGTVIAEAMIRAGLRFDLIPAIPSLIA